MGGVVVRSLAFSTKSVAWFDEAGERSIARLTGSPQRVSARAPGREEMVNDLEAPVAARYPAVARIAGALRKAGAIHAGMSGSGSAVFGLFRRRADAFRAAAALASRGQRTIVTRTLNRSKYQALAAK